MNQTLLHRIGIDIGRKLKLEDAIAWATRQGVRFIDIELDTGANAFTRFDAVRSAAIRDACAQAGVQLGLHTSSAVNVAEYAPLLSNASDSYLRAYVDAAAKLGAGWIVVHAGFHFGSDQAQRMEAGLERLRRAADYAEAQGVTLLLENLNKEPADAEVHYLAHTLDEWRWYYDRIDSPALALAFTANHAHLVPEGVAGFVASMPIGRVREVRLADCFRNGTEQHLCPGHGDFDFPQLFSQLEAKGFAGHYMAAFGSLDDMLAGRKTLAAARQENGDAPPPVVGRGRGEGTQPH
ncbi:MAG TPA: sugar phosphate isomerase/epimerase family protein [Acetobacteraceae bacterium]|nr:sugar phosphate isomerase/epimerase family protein [Acetobacteraceae bacterium]